MELEQKYVIYLEEKYVINLDDKKKKKKKRKKIKGTHSVSLFIDRNAAVYFYSLNTA